VRDVDFTMRFGSSIVALGAIVLGVTLVVMCGASGAAHLDTGIWYTDDGSTVTVGTKDVDIAINKLFPAVAIRPADSGAELGYGMTISSVIGYNETMDDGLILEEAHYHASFEHSTWEVDTPVESNDPVRGDTLTVTMHSSVNINRRLIFGGGNPEPGSPGIEIIEDWATVTITFTIATGNYSSHYDVSQAPDYLVNGSSELKFDVRIDINEPIDADHITLDIGLMKMNFGTFEPTAMPEAYLFHGYQSDGVSVSYPEVNETDGDLTILHKFNPRDRFKQIFSFVEEDRAPSYFSWARQALLTGEAEGAVLTDTTTYYRTDGTSLRVYVATPITNDMTSILHDPSLGMFDGDGGYLRLPDGSLIGASAFATTMGVLIGLAAGGATVFVVSRRLNPEDENPEDLVALEKNRYFKGK